MSNFQKERLDLQKAEIQIMQQSVDDNKKRLKAQDGFKTANDMIEKWGHKMNETQFDYWFGVANKWAMEMTSFDAPPPPPPPPIPDYDTPVIPSTRPSTSTEDPTISSRLYENDTPSQPSHQKKKAKPSKEAPERNYSSLSSSLPTGRPPIPPPAKSSVLPAVPAAIPVELPTIAAELPTTAAETLEYILGTDGEPIVDPVYETSVAMYQNFTVPTALPNNPVSAHPFNKDPTPTIGLKSSAPSMVMSRAAAAIANPFDPCGYGKQGQVPMNPKTGKPIYPTPNKNTSSSSSSSNNSNSSSTRSVAKESNITIVGNANEGKREKKKKTIASV